MPFYLDDFMISEAIRTKIQSMLSFGLYWSIYDEALKGPFKGKFLLLWYLPLKSANELNFLPFFLLNCGHWILKKKEGNFNHYKCTISFIIFWDLSMLYQIFLSPQVKWCAIITYKQGIYELPHELPNNLRLWILGN